MISKEFDDWIAAARLHQSIELHFNAHVGPESVIYVSETLKVFR